MSYQHAPHQNCPICQEALIESLTRERDQWQKTAQTAAALNDGLNRSIEKVAKEREALRKAAQLALDWATGAGPYAQGKDTVDALAEQVAPALEGALQ